MTAFACNLLIAEDCEQFLEATVVFATFVIPYTSNYLIAAVYLRWFTCDSNFHSIKLIIIILSYYMRCNMGACEILRLMVKTIYKSNKNQFQS